METKGRLIGGWAWAAMGAALGLGIAACGTTATQSIPTTKPKTQISLPSVVVPTSQVPPTSPVGLASVKCSTSQLSLAAGAPVSEMTQQTSLMLVLTNIGRTPCYMNGYPGIGLYDQEGTLLPLSYKGSGDLMVTLSSPTRVDLGPGISAYVLINKNACIEAEVLQATTLHLTPPNDSSALTLDIQGLRPLDSCESGDVPATSELDISPVEATEALTYYSGTDEVTEP